MGSDAGAGGAVKSFLDHCCCAGAGTGVGTGGRASVGIASVAGGCVRAAAGFLSNFKMAFEGPTGVAAALAAEDKCRGTNGFAPTRRFGTAALGGSLAAMSELELKQKLKVRSVFSVWIEMPVRTCRVSSNSARTERRDRTEWTWRDANTRRKARRRTSTWRNSAVGVLNAEPRR